MRNEEVARVFREMADLLRIDGGEAHRAKAFERTAEILESLPEPATELLRFGRLSKVKGIGQGSVDRIKEVLRTGTCADQRRLRARVPVGLREVLGLRDVGPALVRQLWTTLGVTNLASLEAALMSGRLSRLPGIGPRTVELIAQSLAHEKRHVQRLLLPDALVLGEKIRVYLEAQPACVRALQVGSARRREETVGDLDFAAAAVDIGDVVRAFSEMPFVEEVLLRAPTRGSVRCFGGRQADLWVVPPESFGACLHAFSGRKAHVVELRKRANQRGLHLSELGIARDDGARVAPGTREEEIFAAVGLPFIEPELRQASGEIEAAEKGRLPTLLEASDLLGDTRVMACAGDDDDKKLRATLVASRANGRRWVIVHVLSEGKAPSRRRVASLRALGADVGIEVLVGALVHVGAEGEVSVSRAGALQVDWVTAKLSSGLEDEGEKLTARLERALASGVVDALACPLGRHSLDEDALPLDIERLMRAARKHEVALELHSDPAAYDLDARGCRLAKDLGVTVAVATGASRADEVERMRFGAFQARRGWLSSRDVLNSLSAGEVRARRAARLGEPLASRPPTRAKRRVASGMQREDAQVASAAGIDAVLSEQLARGDVDDGTLERLERWLREGGDDALEKALAGLSPNPMQKAFELTMLARAARAR